MHSKNLKKFLAKKLVESAGILFTTILVFAAIVYAVIIPKTWDPGQAPQAAPGLGNVKLPSGGDSVWSESSGNVFRASGNVGIGTTSPDATLEVKGTVKMFGDWGARSVDQQYTAATDGFVLVYCAAASSANGVTPDSTYPKVGAEASGTEGDGFCMPVKKGDTWKVYLSSGVASAVTVTWIPLGT